VVVGGGFGGLQTVKALRGAPVEVTLIDRNNYHLFQPLNYQVATGALSPDEIAEPLRTIFRRDPNVHVVMGEVTEADLERRIVRLEPRVGEVEAPEIQYDTLVVAGGSTYSYFGHDEWRPLALEVKSLNSTLEVRSRILSAFEAAEIEQRPEVRAAWLTFVVVGGGPTGVEMAGQIAELARDTLPRDFKGIDTRAGRVLLVETADRVLPAFPAPLPSRAAKALEELGVTPLVDHTVVGIDPVGVDIQVRGRDPERVPARTVIWAAGVAASPLAGLLANAAGAEVDRAGRLTVEPDLALQGHPEVLAIGDMVRVRNARTGQVDTLPGLAPVAMQQGRYVGRLIRKRLAGDRTAPFHYVDKGSLATIGRARAVADIHGLKISGFFAWATWLLVHIYYLIGFENRIVVLVRWAYYFFTRGRGGRLITDPASVGAREDEPAGSRSP
jgi:NADH:quinone reductase (non-electrogenic)